MFLVDDGYDILSRDYRPFYRKFETFVGIWSIGCGIHFIYLIHILKDMCFRFFLMVSWIWHQAISAMKFVEICWIWIDPYNSCLAPPYSDAFDKKWVKRMRLFPNRLGICSEADIGLINGFLQTEKLLSAGVL